MSAETITMLAGIVSILVALAGALGWLIHRIDGVRDEISASRRELGSRIDKVESNLGARIDKVADELVEVKIAVARFEGPPRQLLPVR